MEFSQLLTIIKAGAGDEMRLSLASLLLGKDLIAQAREAERRGLIRRKPRRPWEIPAYEPGEVVFTPDEEAERVARWLLEDLPGAAREAKKKAS